jgi:hypothetical protein
MSPNSLCGLPSLRNRFRAGNLGRQHHTTQKNYDTLESGGTFD